MAWLVGQRDFGPPHYYAHTNYVTIIVPSQSCLFSFLHRPYMCPFSICKIFHLLVIIMVVCARKPLAEKGQKPCQV